MISVALESAAPEWAAVEASSFQLHDAPHLDPAVGVITNLSPDHLDRYASVEDYYADKRLLFRNATDRSVWVLNGEDAGVLALAQGAAGQHRFFRLDRSADAWFDAAAGWLMLAGQRLLARVDLPLLGRHNVANALAAALAVESAGVAAPVIARGLAGVRGLAHRLEPVREVRGVLWINDSKSTNLTSTEVAIRSMTRPTVLLLGGRHKGEPYDRLLPAMQSKVRQVLAFGEAAERVQADLAERVPVERVTGGFEQVVHRAAEDDTLAVLAEHADGAEMGAIFRERRGSLYLLGLLLAPGVPRSAVTSPPLLSTLHHVAGQILAHLELHSAGLGGAIRRAARATSRATVDKAVTTVKTGTMHLAAHDLGLGASRWVDPIIARTDAEMVVERRRRNFSRLAEALDGIMPVVGAPLLPGVCPLFLPVRIDGTHRNGLDKPALTISVKDRDDKERTLLIGKPIEKDSTSRYAKLSDSDLTGADMRRADLTMADLRCNLNDANLSNAD